MNISFISLGCAKNLVDSEYILGMLRHTNNIEVVDSLENSDVVFINTCGFINDAKKEAIDTIFYVLNNKNENTKVVVIGCLAKRYKKDLLKEIPEIDAIIGVDEYDHIGTILNDLLNTQFPQTYNILSRSLTNPLPVAYLKIGEGCSNNCAYCAIPLIRGKYYSYKKEIILEDAKRLISLGKKEITVIAQDPTRYGKDLYDDNYLLEDLLEDLVKLDRNTYFRVLYLYPDRITDRLIEVFKNNDNLINYFDIPIQHSENKILSEMKRSGTKEKYYERITKIKKEIPDAIFRTTIMVGFGSENRKDFKNLISFIKDIQFNHLGAFTYSKEEDTDGYNMKHTSKIISKLRLKKLMKIQRKISLSLNQSFIGKTIKVLIEDYDGTYYKARSYMHASDDVDGFVYVSSNSELIIGEFYEVLITSCNEYDLIGETNGIHL